MIIQYVHTWVQKVLSAWQWIANPGLENKLLWAPAYSGTVLFQSNSKIVYFNLVTFKHILEILQPFFDLRILQPQMYFKKSTIKGSKLKSKVCSRLRVRRIRWASRFCPPDNFGIFPKLKFRITIVNENL